MGYTIPTSGVMCCYYLTRATANVELVLPCNPPRVAGWDMGNWRSTRIQHQKWQSVKRPKCGRFYLLFRFFFCFLLSPLVSDCQSVYSTRLVLAEISHGLCTTQPVRSKRHSNEDADGCGKHFDDCFFNQFYVCWFQIIE